MEMKKNPEVWEYVLGRKFTGTDYQTPLSKEEFLMGGTRVEEIRKRYKHYETVKPNTAVADIRELLDVIDRLVKDRK